MRDAKLNRTGSPGIFASLLGSFGCTVVPLVALVMCDAASPMLTGDLELVLNPNSEEVLKDCVTKWGN